MHLYKIIMDIQVQRVHSNRNVLVSTGISSSPQKAKERGKRKNSIGITFEKEVNKGKKVNRWTFLCWGWGMVMDIIMAAVI